MSLFDKVPDVTEKLDLAKLPAHVAIIMDGNGRWAKSQGQSRMKGHRAGVMRLHDIVAATSDLGIEALTVYAFSSENWKRPPEEIDGLMRLLIEFLYREIDEIAKNNIRITFIGEKDGLGKNVLLAMDYAKNRTKANTGTVLNLAFNYGGRQAVAKACMRLAEMVERGDLSARDITAERLYDAINVNSLPEVDFVIRTSGEQRMSNFMPYETTYSELYFTSAYWPDFDEQKYVEALACYQNRNRRYGGI